MTEDETYCIEGTDLPEKDIWDMESAAETLTSGNLADASFHIDCALNRDGYAQRNPELVAAFIQTQAIHLQTLMQRRTGQEIRDALLAIAAKLGGAVR